MSGGLGFSDKKMEAPPAQMPQPLSEPTAPGQQASSSIKERMFEKYEDMKGQIDVFAYMAREKPEPGIMELIKKAQDALSDFYNTIRYHDMDGNDADAKMAKRYSDFCERLISAIALAADVSQFKDGLAQFESGISEKRKNELKPLLDKVRATISAVDYCLAAISVDDVDNLNLETAKKQLEILDLASQVIMGMEYANNMISGSGKEFSLTKSEKAALKDCGIDLTEVSSAYHSAFANLFPDLYPDLGIQKPDLDRARELIDTGENMINILVGIVDQRVGESKSRLETYKANYNGIESTVRKNIAEIFRQAFYKTMDGDVKGAAELLSFGCLKRDAATALAEINLAIAEANGDEKKGMYDYLKSTKAGGHKDRPGRGRHEGAEGYSGNDTGKIQRGSWQRRRILRKKEQEDMELHEGECASARDTQ